MLATMRSAPLVVLCPTRHGARLHAAGRAVCSLQPACCTLSCSTHVTDQRQVLKAEAVLLVFCCTTHCCTALHSCIVVRRFGASSLGTVRRRRPRPTGATSCVNAASTRAASSPPPRGARCAPVCAGTARSARQQGPPWTARACTGTEQAARDIQCREEHSGAAHGRQITTREMHGCNAWGSTTVQPLRYGWYRPDGVHSKPQSVQVSARRLMRSHAALHSVLDLIIAAETNEDERSERLPTPSEDTHTRPCPRTGPPTRTGASLPLARCLAGSWKCSSNSRRRAAAQCSPAAAAAATVVVAAVQLRSAAEV